MELVTPVPKPKGRVRWIVSILLFSAVVLSYVDRLVLGVLKPHLEVLYGWTNAGYGDVTGYFQVVYGIGFLFFGWLIDRIGPRLGNLLAVGTWTVGHFAQTLVTPTTVFAMPGDLFPRYARGTLIGLGGFAGATGGFIASKSLGALLDRVGSYQPFFIACGLAYLLALLVTHLINPRYAAVRMGP